MNLSPPSRSPGLYRVLTVSLLFFAVLTVPFVAGAGGEIDTQPRANSPLSLTVNSTGDAADANPGDGVCDTDTGTPDAQCTLRAALQETNAAPTADAIRFSLPANSAITLLTKLPNVDSDLAINGPGANTLTVQRSAAQGTPEFIIFRINSGKTVSISGLTITKGSMAGVVGGIYNEGALTITGCTITGNFSHNGIGGIYNSAQYDGIPHGVARMTINSSIISGNTPGGIYNAASDGHTAIMTINDSIVSDNPALNFLFGGVNNACFDDYNKTTAAVLTINNSTISGNGATGNNNSEGGGIFNQALGSAAASAALTVNGSTISSNSAGQDGRGGGIFNMVTSYATASVSISDSTISGNSAGIGGGIYNEAYGFASAPISITNSTIYGNSTFTGRGGGIFDNTNFEATAPVKLSNTIVAGNSLSGGLIPQDIHGAVDPASSFNLIGVGGSGGLTNGVNNNQVGVRDALLAPLAQNGGPTATHALLPGSPAINAGDTASAPATDQRGVARVGVVDIGAFESRGFSIAATSGTLQSAPLDTTFASLVATVTSAFGEPVKGGVVTFTAPASGPSATFLGNVTTTLAPINPSGQASVLATANRTAGGPYNVMATANGASSAATFSLTNLPTLSINDVSVTEGNSGITNATFDVNLSAASNLTVTVSFSTADGTATVADNDYLASSGALTFGPGETTKTITVPIKGDTRTESDETFFVNLSGATNAVIARPQGVGTIRSDDTPLIQFGSRTYSVAEGGLRIAVTVDRIGDLSKAASARYLSSDLAGLAPCSTASGIASERCDYATVAGVLNFAAGERQKTFYVPIVNDSYAEGAESFDLRLSNFAGAEPGSFTTTTVTINDNDPFTRANPLDSDEFFVRQLYIDLLGREPDPPGLRGWLNTLDHCAVPTDCDRTAVALGFVRSPEFLDRAYFIYRLYAAALGRAPRYSEFIPDTALVNGFLTGQELEANKATFIDEFMGRNEFRQKYDQLITPTDYVVGLLRTAGMPDHPSRDAWVAGLTFGTMSRAQVLRALVESTQVYTKYYNESLIVTHYFRFLRRDPDGLYRQWVETFNHTNDYRLITGGFINSPEYRLRFGP